MEAPVYCANLALISGSDSSDSELKSRGCASRASSSELCCAKYDSCAS